MLARRFCNTSFMAFKTTNIVQRQSQIRLFNVSAMALKDMNAADQNKKVNNFSNDLNKGNQKNNLPLILAVGVVSVGAAYMIFRSKSVGKKVDDVKDSVVGHYITGKADKEFENAKEIIVKVAEEIGGKDLADKVSKVIDEAKETLMKMAKDMNVSQNAGKVYREAKDKIQKISEHGISGYASEFDNVKEFVVNEAKKIGGDDLGKKANKIFDEAKDKIEKIVSNIGKDGINAGEFKNVQEYIVKETKKIGGDDLAKKATKIFDEAKEKIQSMASNIGEHGISSEQFEKVKEFVVKEAEKIGGKDLAKKASKMMDEAKETIQKIASQVQKKVQ